MTDFDIRSLLKFKPAQYMCEKCLALLHNLPISQARKEGRASCPICRVDYLGLEQYEPWELAEYLRSQGYGIKFSQVVDHSRRLAIIVDQMRLRSKAYPPLRGLLIALSQAQKFVHFTSYNISHMMIGALKMTAQRVAVRGIVSGVDSKILAELTNFENEAPDLKIKAYGTEANWKDMPHQKLVVIDGLLAFKGSANLTLSGWRKAAEGREMIEPVTDIGEVIDLHNRFFSPIWAELSDMKDYIEMKHDVPW